MANNRDTTAEKNGKVIVVDDEPHQRLIMEEAVKSMGYDVTVVETGAQALEKIRFGDYDVLLSDMQMPTMSGIRLLENVMIYNRSVSVVLVTAHGTVETAVDAMKKGAEDYILKPVEFSALELTLQRVFKKRQLVRENRRLMNENEALKRDLGIKYHLSNTIGRSPQSQQLLQDIQKYMKNRSPLLILGEIGLGKTDIARMIHYNSPWARNDLITFDCAAVPEDLQPAHLFGEEQSFEAGVSLPSRPGLVEKAHLGTLILSNIHRLSKKCQPGLSKVLREERSQRLGGKKFYSISVRVIATSRDEDFSKAVSENEFRWDIHDLLLENALRVAAIRERKEDIPLLIAAAAKRLGQLMDKEITKIDRAIVDKLAAYDFPGNNRELEAMVESAVIRCNETTLKLEHFAFPAGLSPSGGDTP